MLACVSFIFFPWDATGMRWDAIRGKPWHQGKMVSAYFLRISSGMASQVTPWHN
jgi:hypothetical protein